MPVKTERELSASQSDLWKRARAAIDSGQIDYAVPLLQSLLKAEPAFLEGRKRLRAAEIQKHKGQSSMARQMASMKTGTSLLKAGSALKKDPVEAMALVEEVLVNDPFGVKANQILADAADALGYWEISMLAYETMCEGRPDDKEALHRLAGFYLKISDLNRARATYERILQIDPRDGDAQSGMKNTTARLASQEGGWEKGGDFRESLKNREQADALEQENKVVKSDDAIRAEILRLNERVQSEPQNLTWPKQIGALYGQLNECENAMVWYQYAYDQSGQADGALEKLISDLKLKSLEQNIVAYRAAAETDPATYQAAVDALIAEKKTLVLEQARKRVARYPNNNELRYELGQALLDHGQPKEAVSELQLGMKAPSVRLQSMNLLGTCYWRRNMLDLAVKTFESVASEVPGINEIKKEILYNLGCVLEASGKKEAAIEKFKEIYENDSAYKDVTARVEASYGHGV